MHLGYVWFSDTQGIQEKALPTRLISIFQDGFLSRVRSVGLFPPVKQICACTEQQIQVMLQAISTKVEQIKNTCSKQEDVANGWTHILETVCLYPCTVALGNKADVKMPHTLRDFFNSPDLVFTQFL